MLATACGGVVEPAAATESETTGGDGSSTGFVTPSTGASTTTGGTSDPDDTTGDSGNDPASSSDESGGFIDAPDGGVTGSGFCVGLTEVGYLTTVHAATDAPVDPTCSSTPDACGGDVVGTWTIASHCGLETLPNFFENECPGSAMTFLGSDVQGTRTFADDSTFALETTLAIDVEVELDTMDCFGIDCETFETAVNDQDNNLVASCSVAVEGDACVCLMTITNATESDGTWAMQEGGIVLTVAGESADPIPACADGDRLELWEMLHESRAYPETPCSEASDCEDALGDAHDEWLCVD